MKAPTPHPEARVATDSAGRTAVDERLVHSDRRVVETRYGPPKPSLRKVDPRPPRARPRSRRRGSPQCAGTPGRGAERQPSPICRGPVRRKSHRAPPPSGLRGSPARRLRSDTDVAHGCQDTPHPDRRPIQSGYHGGRIRQDRVEELVGLLFERCAPLPSRQIETRAEGSTGSGHHHRRIPRPGGVQVSGERNDCVDIQGVVSLRAVQRGDGHRPSMLQWITPSPRSTCTMVQEPLAVCQDLAGLSILEATRRTTPQCMCPEARAALPAITVRNRRGGMRWMTTGSESPSETKTKQQAAILHATLELLRGTRLQRDDRYSDHRAGRNVSTTVLLLLRVQGRHPLRDQHGRPRRARESSRGPTPGLSSLDGRGGVLESLRSLRPRHRRSIAASQYRRAAAKGSR